MSDDYKVNGKEYSLMSPTNERILNRLVNNNVYCNMTQEIEFIINALLEGANDSSAPFDVNDYDAAIENGMEPVCEDCGACDNFEDYDPLTADETELPTAQDILDDVNVGVGLDEENEYFNSWGITDHFGSQPLALIVGEDIILADE